MFDLIASVGYFFGAKSTGNVTTKQQEELPIISKPVVIYPQHKITREEFMDFMLENHSDRMNKVFRKGKSIDKCVQISKNHGIDTRYFINDLESMKTPLTSQEKADIYLTSGLDLVAKAVEKLLTENCLNASDITDVILISHFPWAFPSACIPLMNKLKLNDSVQHYTGASAGCSGGGALLRQVAELSTLKPESIVLGVNLELCSLGFNHTVADVPWIINSTLFGDAAGAVLGFGTRCQKTPRLGIRISALNQESVKNTHKIGGFTYDQYGYHFSQPKELCDLCNDYVPNFTTKLCEEGCMMQPKDMSMVVLHPGGKKIFSSIHRELELPKDHMELQLESFKEIGNCAGCSVLDLLSRSFRDLKHEDTIAAVGYGPGFVMEGVAGKVFCTQDTSSSLEIGGLTLHDFESVAGG